MVNNRIVGLTVILSFCVFGHVLCLESSEEDDQSGTENPYTGIWYLLAVGNSKPRDSNFSCGWFNVTKKDKSNDLFINFKIIGNDELRETIDRVEVIGSEIHYKIPRHGINDLVLNMKKYNDDADMILSYNSTDKSFAELVSRNTKASADAKIAFSRQCKKEKLFITKIDHADCSYN